MAKVYRWGIMGAGIIARKLAGALASSGTGKLAYVASRSGERAEAFAREFGVEAWGSYERLFAEGNVDVVYVATTHNFHRENARMALEAGKPVLMEKPFTVNGNEAAELIALAGSKGLFLMEAMWTRFLPTTVALKKLVAEGGIGRLRYMDISFGNFALPMYQGRLQDPALAGGVTLDMGIYPISFACHLAGAPPEDIRGSCNLTERGVDDFAAYQFRYSTGTIANIATSFALAMENRALLYGTEGYIELPAFPSGNSFTLHRHGGGRDRTETENFSFDHGENGFAFQVAEVHRCLDAGLPESPVMPLEETRALMGVMDKLRRDWGLRYPCEGA